MTYRFTQTGQAGVLLQQPGLVLGNQAVAVDQADPDNPVALGLSTRLRLEVVGRWQIYGTNLEGAGPGEFPLSLPVGDYEITLDLE